MKYKAVIKVFFFHMKYDMNLLMQCIADIFSVLSSQIYGKLMFLCCKLFLFQAAICRAREKIDVVPVLYELFRTITKAKINIFFKKITWSDRFFCSVSKILFDNGKM